MKTKYLLPIIIIIMVVVLFLQSCSSGFTVSYTGDYCEDSIVDRDETGVDCGGQYCDPCDAGYTVKS